MSKTKQDDVTTTEDTMNAVLRFRDELPYHDIKFKDNKIVIINIGSEKISIYISGIDEEFTTKKDMRIILPKQHLDQQRKFMKQKGNKAAFVGWFRDSDIFVAWDPRHVFSLKPSTGSGSSIRGQLKMKQDTTRDCPSTYKSSPEKLNEDVFAISMHASMLAFYFKNMESLHSMSIEEEIISAMIKGSTGIDSGYSPSGRNLFAVSDSYWAEIRKRDPEFRRLVLKAYNNACCVCGKKLGIVEAAHIIPHSCDPTNNKINNGLALCVEHHVLYDKAILMPDGNYRLVFNEALAKELEHAGLGTGLNEVKKYHRKKINLPKVKSNWPSKSGLKKGIKKRDPRAVVSKH